MMVRFLKFFTLLVGVFAFTMLASTDSYAEHGDPAAGKAVYEANCGVCHGMDGNSPLAAAGMAVPNFAKGERLDKPFEERFKSVCEGRTPEPPTPPMPPNCEKLSVDEIHNAIAYEETFKP